jgi:hypothetical protein
MSYTDEDREYYFPDIISKINAVFMSGFTDIRVAKYDENKVFLNYRKVPVIFGSKQKAIQAAKKKTQKEFNMYLPRISVLPTGLIPNRQKSLGGEFTSIYKELNDLDADKVDEIFGPSYWKLEYSVSIMSATMGEVNQILEQILPYYTPTKTYTIKEFDIFNDFTRDIKITLNSTSPEFQDEILEDDNRRIIWDINFTVDCALYKPILLSNIIKSVNVELFDASVINVSGGNLLRTYTHAVSGSPDDYDVITDEWN